MADGRIIGVVSGKGGVGKTTLCVNLALGLNELGKEVTVVDTDFDASNLGVHLGQYEHPIKMHDVLHQQADPEDAIFRHSSGMKAMVASNEIDRGIILCGSGVGVSVAANKIPGVRAGVCHDTYSARQGVEHDDMNILCIGARVIGSELIDAVVQSFVEAEFSGAERHRRRLEKVLQIERDSLDGAFD